MAETKLKVSQVKNATTMSLYTVMDMAVDGEVELDKVVAEMHKGVNEFFDKLIQVTKREVIFYHMEQGKSFEEIAKDLDMDIAEVRDIAKEA